MVNLICFIFSFVCLKNVEFCLLGSLRMNETNDQYRYSKSLCYSKSKLNFFKQFIVPTPLLEFLTHIYDVAWKLILLFMIKIAVAGNEIRRRCFKKVFVLLRRYEKANEYYFESVWVTIDSVAHIKKSHHSISRSWSKLGQCPSTWVHLRRRRRKKFTWNRMSQKSLISREVTKRHNLTQKFNHTAMKDIFKKR